MVRWLPSGVVCLDADDAGRKGADKIVAALGTKASIVELPVPDEVRRPPTSRSSFCVTFT